MSKTIGAHEVDGKVICDGCGADLSADGSVQFVAHFDGKKTYGYIYNCCKCGQTVQIEHKRRGLNKALWA